MAVIGKLPPHLADMIAAGEVVERPANVIKELLENAFDADAQFVTVEIEKGGVTLMRVSDDGCGMEPADMVMAFERHATSKIHQTEDLEAIVTMGFRGEALAAVAAVSRVTMTSRRADDAMGHEVSVQASALLSQHSVGGPQGTTVVVRDLFFNTPARYKFLKKDATEAGYIQSMVMRAALSRPDVSVRFVKDGQQVFQTPGDSDLRSAIYCLYGRELLAGMLPVSNEYEGMSVTGFTGQPSLARGNRALEIFVVNGRPVGSKTLMAALEEAYAKMLLTGRYPISVLHLDMDPSLYDINVHPAKAEIKFARERQVFEAVYMAVRNALQQGDAVVRPTLAVAEPTPAPTETLTMRQPELQLVQSRPVVAPPPVMAPPPIARPATPPQQSMPIELPQQVELPQDEPWRVVGEVLGGYILIEQGQQLLLLDKHAAHERLLYERWAASQPAQMAQQLLAPLVVRMAPDQQALLLQHSDLLEQAGFELDDYGDGALLLRAVPHDLDADDAGALLDELAHEWRSGRRGATLRTRDELLKMVSCKAAIKIGKRSSRQEIEALAQTVMTTPTLRHCPHGRPLLVSLSRKEVEKLFLRQ